MKKLVQVQEVPNEGLLAFMGQDILVFCASYIYSGNLIGVNDDCILLDDAKIVYETGAFTTKGYSDAQSLPGKQVYLMKNFIESFCAGK